MNLERSVKMIKNDNYLLKKNKNYLIKRTHLKDPFMLNFVKTMKKEAILNTIEKKKNKNTLRDISMRILKGK